MAYCFWGEGVDARVRNYGLADKIKEIPHYRIACYVLQFIAYKCRFVHGTCVTRCVRRSPGFYGRNFQSCTTRIEARRSKSEGGFLGRGWRSRECCKLPRRGLGLQGRASHETDFGAF